MSKSAIKTITTAQAIIAKAGVSLPHLVNAITDKELRKKWRNADKLAHFIVICLAEFFETETLDSCKERGWPDMAHACHMCLEGNYDRWDGKSWNRVLGESWNKNNVEMTLNLLRECVGKWVVYHIGVTLYEVVENGPDSFDYVTHTMSNKCLAERIANDQERANAHLGYGYRVRAVDICLTKQQHRINDERKAYAAHLLHVWDEYSAVVAAECEAYEQEAATLTGDYATDLNHLAPIFGFTDALRIIKEGR